MTPVVTALQTALQGQILTDSATLAEMSTDFGRIVERLPAAVVRPASAEDVAAVVRAAAREGSHVTARGAAHSQNAQGLSSAGILIDMRSLAGQIVVDENAGTVTCLAGTIWGDVVAETMRRGLIPPVLTNNLSVTVGGTLSVAGIGVASFRDAAQVDTCLGLQVVTGNGDIVDCDPTHHPDLFDAVRSGLGFVGLITRATIRLRRAKPMARTFHLLYDDLDAVMRDERTLIERNRIDYVESWCVPCPQGFRPGPLGLQMFAEWFFPVHVTVEYEGAAPAAEEVLDGLAPYKRPHVGDQPTEGFARRLEPLFELWRRSGYWGNAHPWMETILPWQTAQQYINQVLSNLPPPALGGGHVLLWPCRGHVSKAPLFRTPDSDLVMGFGILPGVPREFISQATTRLMMASELATMMGGKRYVSGYLNFDRAHWKAHYGDRWDWLLEMKQRHDPDGILNPGLFPPA